MKAIKFEIRVEGGLCDTVNSRAKAMRMKNKYEAEGWNVQVIAIHETIVGEMGVEI